MERSAGFPSDSWEVTNQKVQRLMSGRPADRQVRVGGRHHRQEVRLDVTFNSRDLLLSAGSYLLRQLQLLQTVPLARKKSLKMHLFQRTWALTVLLTK